MHRKMSPELREMVVNFCRTHRKCDALKRFGLTQSTIAQATRGIDYRNPNNPDQPLPALRKQKQNNSQ